MLKTMSVVTVRYLWRDAETGQVFGRSDEREFAERVAARYAAEPVVGHCRTMEVVCRGEVLARFEAPAPA
jgi:hypothetical protein